MSMAKHRVIHSGITCDGCGVAPIIGVRYSAKHIYDYDVCSACIKDQDMKDFVAYSEPVDQHTVRSKYLVKDTIMKAPTYDKAAELLGRNDKNHTVGRISVSIGQSHRSEQLIAALSSNKTLKILHMHMCGGFGVFEYEDCEVLNLARGIAGNTSIERLYLHIGQQSRNKACAVALRDMIEQNESIEALFIGRPCHDTTGLTFDPVQDDDSPGEDDFATTIFDGLRKNETIKIFRLSGFRFLSEKTKDFLLEIVKNNNDTLEKVYANFQKPDNRLGFLLACRKEKWVERLSDIRSSKRARINVLVEAIQHESAEKEPLVPVYHLLRNAGTDLI